MNDPKAKTEGKPSLKRRTQKYTKAGKPTCAELKRRAYKLGNDRRRRADADYAKLLDGLLTCGTALVGGAALAADVIRRAERSRCRGLVSDRLHRDPELINEILSDIDRGKQ